MKLLKTTDVRERTGWSLIKIRTLIEQGKLKAINSSTSKRPYWNILPESLDELLNGNFAAPKTEAPKDDSRSSSRRRIDDHVPKVFG